MLLFSLIKKSVWITVLGLLASIPASFAGNEGSGGGGLAEQNMRFAYANLGRALEMCLISPRCQLNDEESRLLKKIQQSFVDEGLKSGEHQLVFESEKDQPGFFMIDGAVRVAKTEYMVGAPIYINKDLLYSADSKGELKALDIAAASGVLVHEFGHHQGEMSHDKLDLVAAKIRALLLNDMQRVSYIFSDNLAVTALNQFEAGSQTKSTQLILEDGANLSDLTQLLKSRIKCDDPSEAKATLDQFLLWNLHWGHRQTSLDELTLSLPLEGFLELQCKPTNGWATYISTGWMIKSRLVFSRKTKREPFRFISDSAQFWITLAE